MVDNSSVSNVPLALFCSPSLRDAPGHTPGPLTYRSTADGYFMIDSGPAERIGLARTEADARLWAAAPELLAALQLAESVYRKNVVAEGEPSSVLDAMQAAIAKATGSAQP